MVGRRAEVRMGLRAASIIRFISSGDIFDIMSCAAFIICGLNMAN